MPMTRVALQVVTPLPIDLFLCRPCEQFLDLAGAGAPVHQETLGQYPQDLRRVAAELSSCLAVLRKRYGESIRVEVIDPQSLAGFILSLRHRVRRYPAFIVNGHRISVVEPHLLEGALQPFLSEPAVE
jgi:hypothetical protein